MSRSKQHISGSAVINAPPEDVYGLLADYRIGHPSILPKPFIQRLEVERGGTGAGTIIRLETRAFGATQRTRAEISEPQPGRVLVERYLDSTFVTSFTVDPGPAPGQTLLTIATEWIPRGGMRGSIESRLTGWMLRRIYVKELALIDRHFQKQVEAS
jgi:hypothetical protein